MKILALDYGQENIGIAISDPTNSIAIPVSIVKNDKNLILYLKKFTNNNRVGEIIIGLNISLSGKLGDENRKKMEIFSEKISRLGIPIKFWDERLTTKIANNIKREQHKRSDRNKKIDDIAAALILQNYLDSR